MAMIGLNKEHGHHFRQAAALAAVGILGSLINPVIYTVATQLVGSGWAATITSGTSAMTAYFLAISVGHFLNKKPKTVETLNTR